MCYVGSTRINPNAPARRVRALIEALKALSSEVQYDPQAARFSFKVGDDLYFWIRAGGAKRFCQTFADVIEGPCRFHDQAELSASILTPSRQLPSPR